MQITNAFRRQVMLTAWDLFRSYPERGFADCLRGAWKFCRNISKVAAKFMARARGARRIDLSPSLIRSPIQRSLTGQPLARYRDHQAAAMTARLGY